MMVHVMEMAVIALESIRVIGVSPFPAVHMLILLRVHLLIRSQGSSNSPIGISQKLKCTLVNSNNINIKRSLNRFNRNSNPLSKPTFKHVLPYEEVLHRRQVLLQLMPSTRVSTKEATTEDSSNGRPLRQQATTITITTGTHLPMEIMH